MSLRSLSLLFASGLAACSLSAASLNEVLGRMDQSAASFQTMSGNIRKLTHTHVIDDNSEESGTIILKRAKSGLQVVVHFTKPDPRSVTLHGKKAEMYYPKLKTVQEYNLAQHSDIVDQFMLVGFGTSGKELATNYDIKAAGEETIAGTKVLKLELTPKSAARREKLRQLDLWVADNGAYPVQQKFLQPSGDYTTFTYSDVKLNAPIPDSALKLKLPSGVKRERPQK